MASQQPPAHLEWVGVSPHGRTLEIIAPVFFGISFVAVLLRLYARLSSIRRLLADDYLCIVAQIIGFGLMSTIIVLAEKGGIGWHLKELPPGQAKLFFKVYAAGEILYTAVVGLYKLAVIFLYRNIFGEIRGFNITSWVLISVTGAWFVAGVFATIFQCSPVQTTFDPYIPGVCFNQDAYILAFSLLNMGLDIIILVLPLPLIWRLNLATKKKVALSAVFLLGIIVCVVSILRITSSFPIDFVDPTYSLFQVTMWSQIEPAIGILAACLPTLRQFFFRRRKSTTDRKYGSNTMDSGDKSNTAVALTGWKSNEAYVEVGSDVATPKSSSHPDLEGNRAVEEDQTTSFLDFLKADPNPRSEEVDNKSILVQKTVSITKE